MGAGAWGRNYIREIDAADDVTLSRLASRNPDIREILDLGTEVTDDWRDLIEAGDLHGLVIASPPHTHSEIALMAMERGLAVLIEKPVALDLADAKALMSFGTTWGAIAHVDHIDLRNPAYEALVEQLPRIGDILEIEAVFGGHGPFRPDTPPLWDWGPHPIAACIDIAGRDPETISARPIPADSGEVVRIELDFGYGLVARIGAGNGFAEKQRSLLVRGVRGALRYDDAAAAKLVKLPSDAHRSRLGEALSFGDASPLGQTIDRFARAIRNGSPDYADLELAHAVVTVLSAVSLILHPEANLDLPPDAQV